MGNRSKPCGTELFEEFYRGVFEERWASLKQALLEPVRQECITGPTGENYYLDAGSMEAASALPLPETESILDMCAAPGGKSLVLARRMGADTTLVANELSSERKNRLIRVLDEFLEPTLRQRVKVTGFDAARWSRFEKGTFGAILLDAPCSSERHVLTSPKHLQEWSPARIRNLAFRQWALLSGAWLVLRPGGYLVYSTCALSPSENDNIVEKLLKKYEDAELLMPESPSGAEVTGYGHHILPDRSGGAGPIFYSLVRKKAP